MAQMAFHIAGAGYGGFSGGRAFLAFKYYDGSMLLYETWCQGTGGALVYSAEPFEITNTVADSGDEVLFNFVGAYVVKIKIEDIFVGWGNVNLSFVINEKDSGKLRYSVERQPVVRGISSGGVNITSTFNKLDMCDSDNETAWQNIWAGNAGIRPPD